MRRSPRYLRDLSGVSGEPPTPGQGYVLDTSGLLVPRLLVQDDDSRLTDERVPTDASVDASKIADSLKPSEGASGATEALRALGISTGMAMPGAAYASYTPALTASGASPTLGDGAFVAGRRVVIGEHVNGSATITFGTSGVDPGSGNYYVSLPVTGVGTGAAIAIVGHGWLFDSSTSTSKLVECYYISANLVVLRIDGATSPVTHANPWTWAAGDRIWLSFSYEAA